MARRRGLALNPAVVRQILKSDVVDDMALDKAKVVCAAANRWADSQPRSGAHDDKPGDAFVVVREKGVNRSRYTVRPGNYFGVWLVTVRPSEFIRVLHQARG